MPRLAAPTEVEIRVLTPSGRELVELTDVGGGPPALLSDAYPCISSGAVVWNADGTLNGPQNPARVGEVLTFLATGAPDGRQAEWYVRGVQEIEFRAVGSVAGGNVFSLGDTAVRYWVR